MNNIEHRFLHIRQFVSTDIIEDAKQSPFTTKGGKTICYAEDAEGNITYSVATCSHRDNFCRRIGRTISYGRFATGRCSVITKEQRMKIEQTGEMVSPIRMLFMMEGN
jgi:hypothetical protein